MWREEINMTLFYNYDTTIKAESCEQPILIQGTFHVNLCLSYAETWASYAKYFQGDGSCHYFIVLLPILLKKWLRYADKKSQVYARDLQT